MKTYSYKKIIYITLALLLIVSTSSFAKENFSVEMIETDRDHYYLGEVVDYTLDVVLKKDPKEFESINITFDLSDGLDYESADLEGDTIDHDSMDVKVTQSSGKARFINFEFKDPKKLNGTREFTIHIKAKVNDSKKEGDHLTNRFIAHYKNADGTVGSYQSDFKSKGQVTYEKKMSETIRMYMANVYTDFMTDIQGQVSPGQKLKVSFGDLITEPIVSKDGFFSFSVPKDTKSHVHIDLLDSSGEIIDSKMLKYVGRDTVTRRDVLSVREALDNVGKTDIVESILKNVVIKDDESSNYNLLEEIYNKTKEDRSAVCHHKPYMNGYPDGTFNPGGTVTRAEMSAILSRIIAKEEIGEMVPDFGDVSKDKWYSKYVAHMAREGLMEGYEDGGFKPESPITRAELATIISRMESLSPGQDSYFKDLEDGHWAADDIGKVVSKGIMEGYPNGTFGPGNELTRGEAATIINRTLGRIPDEKAIKDRKIAPFSDIVGHWSYTQVVEATYEHTSMYKDGKEIYE